MENFFPISNVKILKNEDFNTNSEDLISLKNKLCSVILFYVENKESKLLSELWELIAKKIPGNILCACNLNSEVKISQAFIQVKQNQNHPFYWTGIQQAPFILIYRDGWPQGFYNGTRSISAISDFILSQACSPNFHEMTQDGLGVEIDKNFSIGGYDHNPKYELNTSNDKNSDIDTRKFSSSELKPEDENLNNQTNQTDQIDQIDQIDKKNEIDNDKAIK